MLIQTRPLLVRVDRVLPERTLQSLPIQHIVLPLQRCDVFQLRRSCLLRLLIQIANSERAGRLGKGLPAAFMAQ